MRYYPAFLDLRGRRCVVAGGGKVAERKVRTLLRAGAVVHVISPGLTPRLGQLVARKKIALTPRAYQKGDLGVGAQGSGPAGPPLLVLAASNDPETQQRVREDAEALGALVNLADDRAHSSLLVPASFALGDLQVAISTSGGSPALARQLRRRLQASVGQEYRGYLRFLRAARKHILRSVPSQAQRARLFRRLGEKLGDWYEAGGQRRARAELNKLLERVKGQSKNQKAKIKRQKC
jgi:precorrin-2 dehydrogenase/sirohydrochlorin ferrochelatase